MTTTIRYTKDHEYIALDGDDGGIGTIGITAYAQEKLGDVVFVELPAVGRTVAKRGEAAVVESVKAASEVFAPVGGEIVAVNEALEGAPATVNEDPTGAGWFLKIRVADPAELDDLMDEAAYAAYLETVG